MLRQIRGQVEPEPTQPTTLSTEVRAVPTPSQVGRTTLPKVPLSYRWVISDAEMFLKTCDYSLRSPTVLVLLPDHTKTHWELVLKRNATTISLFLSNAPAPAPNEIKNASSSRYDFNMPSQVVKLVISNCTLSVINSSAVESKLTATLPDKVYVLNEPLQNFGVQHFIKNLSDYLEDGTLTVQVDASFNCFSTPSQSLDKLTASPVNSIRQSIKSLYRNDDTLADITLKCAGKEFKAHKVILASQSPVFRKMFEIDMKEKRSDIVEISDLTPEVLSNLLSFIYAGTCPNIRTVAMELLNAANKYQIPSLMIMCEKELEVRVKTDNVFEYLVLAYLHQATHLKASCMRFIKLHPVAVFESKGWKSFKKNASGSLDCQNLLIEILQLDTVPTPKPNQIHWS